jgi:iron complex outermembrane receptor protein
VRHEQYSDTTNPTVPKVTVRYLPFDDQFAIRGSYSESFSAPTLYNLFGPSNIGFTSPFTLTPYDGSADIDNVQTNYKGASNPNLSPATATNYTAGIVYSPKALKGFSISIDYWNIKQEGLITSYGGSTILQDVELNGAASQYADRVKFGGFNGTPVTGPGMISTGVPDDIYVTDALVNLSGLNLDGFDVSAKYTLDTNSIGRFDFQSNIGYYLNYAFTFFPGDPEFETVGKSTVTNGTIPKWQTYTSVDWSKGGFGAFAGVRYLDSVENEDEPRHVGSFYTLDLSASYTFGSSSKAKFLSGAKVTLGVTNAFNRFGPEDPTVNTDSNVDTATYGAMGRFVYMDLRFKF